MRTLINKTKLFFARLFYPVAIFWWPRWSKVYRFLFQRKYKNIVLQTGLSYSEANEKVNTLNWRPDKARELWDSCSSPQWVQYCIDTKVLTGVQPEGPLDCDDFAVWLANVVDPIYEPRILSFSWANKRYKLKGHAVCVCRLKNGKLIHIGNWGISKIFNNLTDLCEDMLTKSDNKYPIGWALFNKRLCKLSYGRNLPKKDLL
jgi:hypothetical protein